MELSIRDISLFIHIAAAAYLIGASLVAPRIGRRIKEAGTRAELLSWLDFLRIVTRFNPLVALVLLATGVHLGAAGWWSSGWFAVSVAAWILSSALAGGVIKPAATKAAKAAAANVEAPIDAEVERLRNAKGWHVSENVMLASDVAILWLMVAKPELVASIAILGIAIGVVALAGLLPRGQQEAVVARL